MIGLSFSLAICAEELDNNSFTKPHFANVNYTQSKQSNTEEPLSLKEPGVMTTFFAQFFYWRVEQNGLNYGYSGTGISNIPPIDQNSEFTVTTPGKSYDPDVDWKPGFRLGIQLNMGEDNLYDLLFRYTYFHPSLKGHFSDPGTPFPSYGVNNFMNEVNGNTIWIHNASLQEKVELNWFDLLAGYTFKRTNFSFRPFMGLSGFYDKNSLKVSYEYDQLNLAPVQAETAVHTSHSTTGGIGPTWGFDCFFHCMKNFGFFGQASASLLWAWQDVSCSNTNTEYPAGLPPTETHVVKGKDKLETFDYKYQAVLGPRCDFWFDNEKSHLYILAAISINYIPSAEVTYLNANNAPSSLNMDTSIRCQGFDFEIGYQF